MTPHGAKGLQVTVTGLLRSIQENNQDLYLSNVVVIGAGIQLSIVEQP